MTNKSMMKSMMNMHSPTTEELLGYLAQAQRLGSQLRDIEKRNVAFGDDDERKRDKDSDDKWKEIRYNERDFVRALATMMVWGPNRNELLK